MRKSSAQQQLPAEPLVSVVMATYNDNPLYLREAIGSIVNQTYSNFELIIADDSTAHESIAAINSFCEDSRVKVLRSSARLGLAPSLNRGLDQARGDLIARMDGDDIALPHRLELQVEYLKARPRCDIVGAQMNIIDESSTVVGKRAYPLGGLKLWCFSLFRNPLANPTTMFRRRILDAGFRYDESMKEAEDLDFWIRLYNAGYKIENMSETLLLYRAGERFIGDRLNDAVEFYTIKARTQNFTLKRPLFSVADCLAAALRRAAPNSLKARAYRKENGGKP